MALVILNLLIQEARQSNTVLPCEIQRKRSAGMDMAYSMYEKYNIYGEEIDSSIIGEAAGLGMSILGCAISSKDIADDARKVLY